jgi:hypothetical protein
MRLSVQEPKKPFQSNIESIISQSIPCVIFANVPRKLFSKRIRSHRVPDPESDLPESAKFGEQVAIDHMVVSKSSGGKEFLVLIV